MKWITQFLDNTTLSNMRINFSLVIYATILLFASIATYIIIFAIRGDEITQWASMGIFIGGVTTSVWAMANEKRKQKQLEKNEGTI